MRHLRYLHMRRILEQFARNLLKRTSRWAAKYYTHDKSYYPVPQSVMPLSAIANTRSKSGLRVTDQYANGRLGVRPQKVRLGPCRQLSSLFIAPTTSLKREFDILKKTMYHQQMHNALSAYNLWTKEMLLRCLRTTEKYKLMGTR